MFEWQKQYLKSERSERVTFFATRTQNLYFSADVFYLGKNYRRESKAQIVLVNDFMSASVNLTSLPLRAIFQPAFGKVWQPCNGVNVIDIFTIEDI